MPLSPTKTLRIAVFGATGQVGRRMAAEAARRGHRVTAIVRPTSQVVPADKEVRTRKLDVESGEDLRAIIAEHDIVISALRPPDGQEQKLLPLTAAVVEAARAAGTRFVVVGGAAPLRLPDDPEHTVLTAPGFLPDSVFPIAEACQQQHDWVIGRLDELGSYLCPPAMLQGGMRTGAYRTGSEQLVTDREGVSRISIEDFAVAALDEAEIPSHLGQQFTVGY